MEGGHANIEIKTIIVITVTHEDAVGNEGSSDANNSSQLQNRKNENVDNHYDSTIAHKMNKS